MKHALLTLAAPIACACAAAAGLPANANADSSPAKSRAEIEIVEIAGAKRNASTFVLGVAPGAGASEASAKIAGALYRTKVSARRGKSGPPIVQVDLHGENADRETLLRLDVVTRAPVGKRVLLTRIESPDGTKFEVALTLR